MSRDSLDSRAELFGQLIAKKMREEHPEVVSNLNNLKNVLEETINKYRKPWYTRLYEKARRVFYKNYR